MSALPESLSTIVEDFQAMQGHDRLELLLEFSDELPPVPASAGLSPDMFEDVPECQSPVALKAQIIDGHVKVYVLAPEQAPTTRGFGSILAQGLSGLTPEAVLDVDDDFPSMLGLRDLVSQLRLNGMHAILGRIKRQVTELLAAQG